MANSNGSFPGCLRRPDRTGARLWRGAIGLWLLGPAVALAGMPDVLREALKKFRTDVPGGWAYTLQTESAGRQTTERFDPSKPPAEQWTLLLTDGRPPTGDEQAKYIKYKAGQAPGTGPAGFQKGDIEPGSVELVREDAGQAEFTCRFREQSANSDKMMGHLGLHLLVDIRHSFVQKFTMTLREPYSPVLGVKMRELAVEMSFTPPGDDRPSLPARSSSHFVGRIFFVPVEENLHLAYSDFTPVP